MISAPAQRLLDGLAAWPITGELTAELAVIDSSVLVEVVSGVLRADPPRAGWYVGGVSDLLSATALDDLAALAVRYRISGPNGAADALIAQVSVQCPAALTAYLPGLWDVAPNPAAYYALWPWRAADDGEITRLLDIAGVGRMDSSRARACLLQTRRPDLLDRLNASTSELLQAGYRKEPGGALTELYSGPPWHLGFPPAILDQWAARAPWRVRHPTWPAATQAGISAITSGFIDFPCPRCRNPLHRLLSLPTIPPGAPVASRQRLEFVWCAGCSPYTRATYIRHDHDGTPAGVTLDFVSTPPESSSSTELESWLIPQTDVTLVALRRRWSRQDWALSNDRQNLHRVGGEPTWIQSPGYPACPGCATTMSSVGQIAVADLWNGEGICYLHWCDTCALSAIVYQQT
jgi:hypothetical protein